MFKIPVIENKEGLYYHLGVTEVFLLEVFRSLYKKRNFVFVDAGVNFGQTLLKIKSINPEINYIGFEPSGLCSYYATLLIKRNRFPHAKVVTCALSNAEGVLVLHAETEGDTRATVMASESANDQKFEQIVPAVKLDGFIPTISSMGDTFLLKVDVEGAELMVFEGADNFIKTYRPVVIFENLPFNGDNTKHEIQTGISHFFLSRNYVLYLLDEESKNSVRIHEISNGNDYAKTNYMAIPTELTKELLAH